MNDELNRMVELIMENFELTREEAEKVAHEFID